MKPQYVYTDGSKEFKKAFQDLNFLADTSTPHRSETNGMAERAVRRIKEGTSCTYFNPDGMANGGLKRWTLIAFSGTPLTCCITVTRRITIGSAKILKDPSSFLDRT